MTAVAELPPPEATLSVPMKVAADIARLTQRRVAYWEQQRVVRPTVRAVGSEQERRTVRLFDFEELMSLLIAAELRNKQVSLQHIRRVVRHLRNRGYDSPLTDVRYAVVGPELYFQHDDGTWEGGLRPDQIVLHEVLNLEPLRMRILEGVKRSPEAGGAIERRRGTFGSKPVLQGTRIPVATVRRYLDAGRSTAQILQSFPALTEADIAAVAALPAS